MQTSEQKWNLSEALVNCVPGNIFMMSLFLFLSFVTRYLSSGTGGPLVAPKSPVRTIVRAHLGNHGHTFVPTKPGITVREALSKAMKLRKLAPETCAVYKLSDPNKVTRLALERNLSPTFGHVLSRARLFPPKV